MKNKFLAIMLACLMILGVATGCGSSKAVDTSGSKDQPKETQTEATKAQASTEKSKVIIWDYFETDGQKQMMTTLLDGFNNSQDQYTVEHVYVPFANFKNQLTVGLQSGELPDLIIIDNPDMASYISMGLFVDISDQITDIDSSKYFPGPWASTMLDGKNYGIPFATNCIALYYNKDMFSAAGIDAPPATWEELKADATKLSKPEEGISGFGFSAVNTEEGTFQFLPWLYMTGATFDNVGGAEGVKTFSFLADMVESGALAKESINWTQSDVNNQFMSGKLAMQENGPWQLPVIASNAPDLNFGVALLPADKTSSSCLGGENLGVVKGNNTAGAVEFLKYYDKPEVMMESMKNYGSFPPKAEVAADGYWTNDPVQKMFIEQLSFAVPRGPSPVWPQISSVLSMALQEALTGIKEPDKVAVDAQAKLDAIK